MISIVIPVYMSAHTITATLDSVRNQTFHDYEIVITDDESSDGSLHLCLQYSKEHPDMRISAMTIPHSGVAAARNHALARASGEYVSFLDSDDRWMPEKLQQIAALTGRDPQADFIYHDVMFVTRDGRRRPGYSGPPPSDPYRHLLLGSNFLATTAVTVRRSSLAMTGGFDCNPDFEICEDYELWLRLARAGAKFAYIPVILAEIVRTEGSLSSNVTRHMKNHLNVRRHSLKQALDDGILSPAELARQGNRIAARSYALIAADQARQWRLMLAVRAATVAAGACCRIALSGDWKTIFQLAFAASRRLIRRLRPFRGSQ